MLDLLNRCCLVSIVFVVVDTSHTISFRVLSACWFSVCIFSSDFVLVVHLFLPVHQPNLGTSPGHNDWTRTRHITLIIKSDFMTAQLGVKVALVNIEDTTSTIAIFQMMDYTNSLPTSGEWSTPQWIASLPRLGTESVCWNNQRLGLNCVDCWYFLLI